MFITEKQHRVLTFLLPFGAEGRNATEIALRVLGKKGSWAKTILTTLQDKGFVEQLRISSDPTKATTKQNHPWRRRHHVVAVHWRITEAGIRALAISHHLAK
jgi:DNA-binding MarR family transcriptional regulator